MGPGGRFYLTPLYDVLTAQPSLDNRQIERKQMKLAMSVGNSRHYKIEDLSGRHFIQTAERAGLNGAIAIESLEEVSGAAEKAISSVEDQLPHDFPPAIHTSVKRVLRARLCKL